MNSLAFITAYKIASKLTATIDLAKLPKADPVSFWSDTKNFMNPKAIEDTPDMVQKLMGIDTKPVTKRVSLPDRYDEGLGQAVQSLDDVGTGTTFMAQNARRVIEENNKYLQGLMAKLKADPANIENIILLKNESLKRGVQSKQMKNILMAEGL